MAYSTQEKLGESNEGKASVTSFQDARGKVADMKDNVVEGVQGFAEKSEEFATDTLKKAQRYATNAATEVTSAIKKHPTEALLAGFGVGCLVGFLVSRKYN